MLPWREPELYCEKHHISGLVCGIFTTSEASYTVFEHLVLVICLAERYCCFETLGKMALGKILLLPMGPREFSCLVKHVLKSIPETNSTMYELLEMRLRLFRPCLAHCEFFRDLERSDDNILLRGLLRLMNKFDPLKRLVPYTFVYCLAVCHRDITVQECVGKTLYGTMFGPQGRPFGAAFKGQVLITDGHVKGKEKLFIGGSDEADEDSWLSYPSSAFYLLNGNDWSPEEDTEEMGEMGETE
ncbi:hypothetical protein HYFRA_00002516 [Hymenoscyphus fraxineus]|uniref:Uncharacterized protein n=1 Tax=Hymenoscyphus fraxineus TaxID=746836 RepID=A0A9N9LAF1_9HELO|nr:hypothetical protein HYFRA_00002516 [Hymenoscyphus fraxineus]